MFTDLHWIPTDCGLRLAIAARPRAGDWLEDEIEHWFANGIRQVVSLLEPHEVLELGLEREAEACQQHGVIFRSFPVTDREVPVDTKAAVELAAEIAQGDLATVIHCRAGIGRSSIIAAAALHMLGRVPSDALEEISVARGLTVPDTDIQRDWVNRLGEAS